VLAGHDRYEALAGAILLGEATPAEREAFETHAAACAPCRADAACAPVFASAFEEGRAAETWRPSVGGVVERRIRETRRSRTRLIAAAMGWCVALSIAVDGLFVSGFAGRVYRALDARAGVASVAAAPAAPRTAAAGALAADAVRAVAPVRRAARRARASVRVAARPHRIAPVAATGAPHAPAAAADVPDVLAGLDLSGKSKGAARNVALEPKQSSRDVRP
jgi:hypothetical protein